MNEFDWVKEEYRYELTRSERWDVLCLRASGTRIPWDRMAIPQHEWLDEVKTLDSIDVEFNLLEGKTINVPRYREELTKEEIDNLDKINEQTIYERKI